MVIIEWKRIKNLLIWSKRERYLATYYWVILMTRSRIYPWRSTCFLTSIKFLKHSICTTKRKHHHQTQTITKLSKFLVIRLVLIRKVNRVKFKNHAINLFWVIGVRNTDINVNAALSRCELLDFSFTRILEFWKFSNFAVTPVYILSHFYLHAKRTKTIM